MSKPLQTNKVEFLRVEIRPSLYGPLRGGSYEARFDVAVGVRRYGCVDFVLNEDELRSRFDQIFDSAREMLRMEMMK